MADFSSPSAPKINLGEVVRRSEPHFDIVECFDMRTNTCPIAGGCALKAVLMDARRQFLAVIDGKTLADVAGQRQRLVQLWKSPRGNTQFGNVSVTRIGSAFRFLRFAPSPVFSSENCCSCAFFACFTLARVTCSDQYQSPYLLALWSFTRANSLSSVFALSCSVESGNLCGLRCCCCFSCSAVCGATPRRARAQLKMPSDKEMEETLAIARHAVGKPVDKTARKLDLPSFVVTCGRPLSGSFGRASQH